MTILDDLILRLPRDIPVRSVLVGLHWTVVCSRFCGMAATLSGEHEHGHIQVKEAGSLQNKYAHELAEYARSEDLLEASIGMAAINSLLDVDESLAVELNASEVLVGLGQGKTVALVGHFPFIPQLRPRVGQLWVIEKQPLEGEYPADAAEELLPKADLVAITGSALINHTLDELLSFCCPETPVMVLGPSTPLSPLLFEYGVNIISGTRVVDESAVLRTVGQGASFRQVEGVRLLNFINRLEDYK